MVKPKDMPCLKTLRGKHPCLHFTAPFINTLATPKPTKKTRHRSALAEQYDLDPNIAWLSIAAVMRDRAKTVAFRSLAEASHERPNVWFHSLIAGDGPTWTEIEAYFADDLRRTFLGLCRSSAIG